MVVLREFDFTWALLHTKRVSNSSIGGWPAFVATWTAHVALVLVLGILWFDWLASQPLDAVRRDSRASRPSP